MKYLCMLFALLLLGLAGCTDASLVGPRDDQGAAKNADQMVPVKWTYEVTAASADMIVCSETPPLAFPKDWVVEGHLSHLGLLNSELSVAQFTECGFDGPNLFADATSELVGANGDAVHLEGRITLAPGAEAALGHWVIVGGTGRYDGASGWIDTAEGPKPDGTGSVGGGEGLITPPGAL